RSKCGLAKHTFRKDSTPSLVYSKGQNTVLGPIYTVFVCEKVGGDVVPAALLADGTGLAPAWHRVLTGRARRCSYGGPDSGQAKCVRWWRPSLAPSWVLLEDVPHCANLWRRARHCGGDRDHLRQHCQGIQCRIRRGRGSN